MSSEAGQRLLDRLWPVEHDPARLLDWCEQELTTTTDDSLYWQLLLATWCGNGREEAPYGERWLKLFQSTRRNRVRGMKKAQRRVFHDFGPFVPLWRAHAPDDMPLSWTTSWTVAYHFGREWGRPVVKRTAYRHEIAFFTDRRGEAEAIIIPGDPQIPSHQTGRSHAYPDTEPPKNLGDLLDAHKLRLMTMDALGTPLGG